MFEEKNIFNTASIKSNSIKFDKFKIEMNKFKTNKGVINFKQCFNLTVVVLVTVTIFIGLNFHLKEMKMKEASHTRMLQWEKALDKLAILDYGDSSVRREIVLRELKLITFDKNFNEAIKSRQYGEAINYLYSVKNIIKHEKFKEHETSLGSLLRKHIKLLTSEGDKHFYKGETSHALKMFKEIISLNSLCTYKLTSTTIVDLEHLFYIERKIRIIKKEQEYKIEILERELRQEQLIKQMGYYSGSDIQMAVPFMCVFDGKVIIYVRIKNNTDRFVYVNPGYFTLSTSVGDRTCYHLSTFDFSSHFDFVDLPPKGEEGGWIIFKLPADEVYTLRYRCRDGSVSKKIVEKD